MNLSWDELMNGFAAQQQFCAGYSPLYETLFGHAAWITSAFLNHDTLQYDEQALIDLLSREWQKRSLSNPVEASLILAGAIHASVLKDEPESAGLGRFYATVGGSFELDYDTDVFRQALGGLFLRPSERIRHFLREGRIQTNEISRGMAWLLPALVLSGWSPGLPIQLVDLGCSAGLNLAADAYAWIWQVSSEQWTLGTGEPHIQQRLDIGRAEPSVHEALTSSALTRPKITARLGVDLHPLHLNNAEERTALRACIWGDQVERLERLDQAMSAYETLEPQPMIEAGNLVEAVQNLHTRIEPETKLLIVYDTVATYYLEKTDYVKLRAAVRDLFRKLPSGVRGLWLEFEPTRPGEPEPPPKLMALRAHALNGDDLTTRSLAYAESHPQTIMLLPGWETIRTLVLP